MRVTLNEESPGEWVEVASVPLPEWMSGLSDEELERARREIENECANAFLNMVDR